MATDQTHPTKVDIETFEREMRAAIAKTQRVAAERVAAGIADKTFMECQNGFHAAQIEFTLAQARLGNAGHSYNDIGGAAGVIVGLLVRATLQSLPAEAGHIFLRSLARAGIDPLDGDDEHTPIGEVLSKDAVDGH